MANVLVVDDEEDILETIPDILKKWGHNPIIAKNGKEGLEKFKEYPIDFVITDMKMPEMDGLALLEKIQQLIQTNIHLINSIQYISLNIINSDKKLRKLEKNRAVPTDTYKVRSIYAGI